MQSESDGGYKFQKAYLLIVLLNHSIIEIIPLLFRSAVTAKLF